MPRVHLGSEWPGPEPRPGSLHHPSFLHPQAFWVLPPCRELGSPCLSPVPQSICSWPLPRAAPLPPLAPQQPEHLLSRVRDPSPRCPARLSTTFCGGGDGGSPQTPQPFLPGPARVHGGGRSLARPSGPCPGAGRAVSPGQVRVERWSPTGLHRLGTVGLTGAGSTGGSVRR